MSPGNGQAAAGQGGQRVDERAEQAAFSVESITRRQREIALTLARLQPLVDSVITPTWARRHLTVIAEHLREELGRS